MPAVTITRRKFNVAGSMRDNFYSVTGASGDTLVVGMNTVRRVDLNAPLTGYTLAAGPIPASTLITFTASGAFTAADIEVIGN
jgi:hypothetical protein